jgi:hypothetical protein
MIYQIPIEPFEERYTNQWMRWFPREFQSRKVPYKLITGDTLTDGIKNGSFLDVCGTNFYKATQLQHICKLFHTREIKTGDIFFFHDLWFPGLEMVAYMRDGLGIDVKICGVLHAGTYDMWDFLFQKGMARWGGLCEMAWAQITLRFATHDGDRGSRENSCHRSTYLQ